jgi:hypothetical protein
VKMKRSNKIIFGISLACICTLSLSLYLFLPSAPPNLVISNTPQSSPVIGYFDQNYEEYDILSQYDYIICKLKYGENLTFINEIQGGATAYLIHTYNNFRLNADQYYLRIIHHISVTSLIRIESYSLQNESWIFNSTKFEWYNPEQFNIFFQLFPLWEGVKFNSFSFVYDDLNVNNTLIEKNHKWLDLGFSEIGEFQSIQGYGSIIIELSNTNAKNAYFGIESISNCSKLIQSVVKFIIRAELSWQRYENHFFKWTTLLKKVYFLGNGILEANSGIESSTAINLMPYAF